MQRFLHQFFGSAVAIEEIIEYDTVTVVPMMLDCMRGAIDLRGSAVPVMDVSFVGELVGAIVDKVNGKFVMPLDVRRLLKVESIGTDAGDLPARSGEPVAAPAIKDASRLQVTA